MKYRTPVIISRSWLQAALDYKPLLNTSHEYKDRIIWKNLLKNKEMVFENGVSYIKAAAYNGARTVYNY